jgi:nucleoside-diphosphate-sugar epimerase
VEDVDGGYEGKTILVTGGAGAIGEAINIGSGTETRVIDTAHEINRLTGNALGVVHIQRTDWDAKTRLFGWCKR